MVKFIAGDQPAQDPRALQILPC